MVGSNLRVENSALTAAVELKNIELYSIGLKRFRLMSYVQLMRFVLKFLCHVLLLLFVHHEVSGSHKSLRRFDLESPNFTLTSRPTSYVTSLDRYGVTSMLKYNALFSRSKRHKNDKLSESCIYICQASADCTSAKSHAECMSGFSNSKLWSYVEFLHAILLDAGRDF